MLNSINHMFSEANTAISPFIEKAVPSLVTKFTKELRVFLKNRWFTPPFAESLKEIPMVFYRNQFLEHAKINKIVFGAYFNLADHVQFGDTILVSNSTQRCKSEYRELASPELLGNLNLADALITEIHEKIPHSPNYCSRTFKAENVNGKELRGMVYHHGMIGFRRRKPFVREVREYEKTKMGVCSELAAAGLVYAWRKDPDLRIEQVTIHNGNHAFLVIGREISNPADYKTWGKNSVICDPWANKYYPVAEVVGELYDYLGTFEDESVEKRNYNGITYPHVRPFNPLNQSLKCLYISPEDKKAILSDISYTFNGSVFSSILST